MIERADRSLPLVIVGAATCHRRLKPGEVKRVPAAGPLVGYYIACPGCGFRTSHVDICGEMGFVEHGSWVSAARTFRCASCARTVSLLAGSISAVTP